MTDDFQEIDGLGPAREEKLNNAGYETYADLANGDPEELAEEVSRLSEDAALEMVVQAQNLADLEDAGVEEDPDPEPEETNETAVEPASEEDGGTDEPVSLPAEEDDGDELYTVELSIDTGYQYDALYDCLLNYRQELQSTNRKGVDQVTGYLDALRGTTSGETLTLTLSKDELNDLHNQLLNHRIDYQGRNFRDQLQAAKEMEQELDQQRKDLFS